MDHEVRAFTVMQRLPSELIDKSGSILCREEIVNRIFGSQVHDILADCEGEEIVIAEDHAG